MLLLNDKPKQMRVMRVFTDDGVVRREFLGPVPKATLAISDELRSKLGKDELPELEQSLKVLRDAEILKQKLAPATFPTAAREAMDYFEGGATEIERRMIASALMDAVRRLRKHERESGSRT